MKGLLAFPAALIQRSRESRMKQFCEHCKKKSPDRQTTNKTTKYCRIIAVPKDGLPITGLVNVRVIVIRTCEENTNHVTGCIKEDKEIPVRSFEKKPEHERRITMEFIRLCRLADLDMEKIPVPRSPKVLDVQVA